MKLVLPHVLGVLTKMDKTEIADSGLPADFAAKVEAAQKFVFESYGDLDERVVRPVHVTTERMIDFGLFHLPFPLIWIEDPVSPSIIDPRLLALAREMGIKELPEGREFYLCEEKDAQITVHGVSGAYHHDRKHWEFIFHAVPLLLDLSPARQPRDDWRVSLNTPLHAVEQFIVTLATKQVAKQAVAGKPIKRKQPIVTREYPYTITRIDVSGRGDAGGEGGGSGFHKHLEFVEGYVWGKHTRPIEGQRWIEPYWRGDAGLGERRHDHYEVRRG